MQAVPGCAGCARFVEHLTELEARIERLERDMKWCIKCMIFSLLISSTMAFGLAFGVVWLSISSDQLVTTAQLEYQINLLQQADTIVESSKYMSCGHAE